MDKKKLQVGDIVQLSPFACRNMMFGGCLMVVTEPKPWGCQGYVQALGDEGGIGGQAYYRANWDEFDLTGGVVAWAIDNGEEGDE